MNFHFSYRLVTPPDGQWGRKYENGSWSGMMGMFQRKVGKKPLNVSGIYIDLRLLKIAVDGD